MEGSTQVRSASLPPPLSPVEARQVSPDGSPVAAVCEPGEPGEPGGVAFELLVLRDRLRRREALEAAAAQLRVAHEVGRPDAASADAEADLALDIRRVEAEARKCALSSRDIDRVARAAAEEHRRRQRGGAAEAAVALPAASKRAGEPDAAAPIPAAASADDEAEFEFAMRIDDDDDDDDDGLEEHETFLLPLAPAGGGAAARDDARAAGEMEDAPRAPYLSLFLFCGLTSVREEEEDEEEDDDDDDDEEEEEEEAEEDCVSCTDAPISCADAPPVQQLPSPPQARSRVRALARRGRSSGETPRPSQATPPSAPPPASSSAPKPAPSWWELVCSTSAPDNRADASERGPRRKKRSASTPASMIL